MRNLRLLDLFCGAGGAGEGYHRAGFEVVGVDKEPQPHYPFEFHLADAFEYLAKHYQEFDIIHASPPCQRYSRITGRKEDHPDLLQVTLDALRKTNRPYILENVPGAPMQNYVMLCGTMFGLRVFRHRLFMCNPQITFAPALCNHYDHSSNGGRNGDKKYPDAKFITVTGSVHPIAKAKKAMGIEWMTRAELVDAIPPAYTEWLGKTMMGLLK
jgi:DNA (cytosine-5)-methyltransferase 1